MKLQKERITNILDSLTQGMSIPNACEISGICRKTYYLWYKKGEEDSEKGIKSLQRELYEGVPVAESRCIKTHIDIIHNAAKKDWHASAWFLERTRPELFGRRQPKYINEDEGNDTLTVIN